MSIDAATLHLLAHQARRLHVVLHETCPPDRAEAERIQLRVNDILDRRPKPIAVSSDGEVLYEGTSQWVLAQTTALNASGKPERVIPADEIDEQVAQAKKQLGL